MENEHSELIIGYLQGRLQGRSLDDFYAWVNESADNKKLFFETKALYEACAPSRGASEIHDSWLRLLDKRKSRQRKRYSLLTRISTYAAAAMFAAAITSTVFIFSSREYDDRITSYVGGDGLEADVVVLPDGTRVSLGTRTSFSYDSRYGKSERIVQLEGEAYFEVKRNTAKPFIVRSEAMQVRVLGTVFNLKSDKTNRSAVATLIKGEIEVKGNHEEGMIVLAPGQKAELNAVTRRLVVKQVDTGIENWHNNQFVFEKADIFTIARTLENSYGVKIILAPDMDATKTYSGTLKKKDNVEETLNLIKSTNALPIEYKIVGNSVFLSSKK